MPKWLLFTSHKSSWFVSLGGSAHRRLSPRFLCPSPGPSRRPVSQDAARHHIKEELIGLMVHDNGQMSPCNDQASRRLGHHEAKVEATMALKQGFLLGSRPALLSKCKLQTTTSSRSKNAPMAGSGHSRLLPLHV